MLAIEVEFLMGRAVCSQWEDRSLAEWPPHPQRLFSALVAAHAELDGGEREELALRWLERLPPPEIKADLSPSIRSLPTRFVPVNDEALKIEKGRADPRHVIERRNRQERHFPAAVPSDPIVVFQWREAAELTEHRVALSRLVESLVYLGHSSSPVRACLRDVAVAPTLTPDEHGEVILRTPGVGRFDRLRSVHGLRVTDTTAQPPLGKLQPYSALVSERRGLFSPDAFVMEIGGPRLALDSTLPLMQHLRSALLARLDGGVDEVLSGHDLQGRPTREPHLAVAPLGFVRARHADGSIKGAALILPTNASPNSWTRLRDALLEAWPLHLGPLGSASIRLLENTEDALASLRFGAYTRASEIWASVTPVVLDRHPKKRGPGVESIIAVACQRIGLPAPVEVRTGPVSAVRGAPPAAAFHGRASQIDNRQRLHVWLRFERPVYGPLLLGAGRFTGLGLCLPILRSRT